MTDNLAIVGFKFNHHGKYSGYQQIVNYLNPFVYLDRDKFDFTFPLLNFKGVRLINQFLKKMRDKMFFDELYKICHNPDIRIIHFLYPENTLALCPFEIPHDKLVIGTFHQPNEYFLEQFKNNNQLAIKNYSRCDRAILLCYDQINGFKSITGIDSVHFIPHGIDTKYFIPSNINRKDNHILFLGNWLRDFECAAGVFKTLSRINKNIKVTVLCNKENHTHFRGISNVQCLSNVSDDQLLILLQTYTLLFLPLKSATANNAILEATACGLPVLTTDLDNIDDYIKLPNCMKIPLSMHDDYNNLASMILSNLDANQVRIETSNNVIKCVNELSWKIIAQKTIDVYY
jgi:glycosyltransferase involved in cell wall biosynthesis